MSRGLRFTALLLSSVLATSLLSIASSATGAVRSPPANGRADYQLGGAYHPAKGVDIVLRDRLARPARHRYNVCYVNSFQTQPGALRWWRQHHSRVLLRRADGTLVRDPGWRAEVLFDTSAPRKRRVIARVQRRWYERCARDGYDAVEPDNLDSWTRSRSLLDRSDNIALARRLARIAHRRDLAIAQKNTPQLNRKQRRKVGFDFAVAESCQVYRECGAYTRTYGRRTIEIEYTDGGRRAYRKACRVRGDRISVLLRDRDVVPRGHSRYRYRSC